MKKSKLERSIEVLTRMVALATAIVGVLEVISDFNHQNEEKKGEA